MGIAVAALLIAAFSLTGLSFTGSAAHADVQDFSYDSWVVEAQIGLDSEGRSIAHMTERITARFPPAR